MINGKRCIGIVTARGGSKRIPGKNIKKFRGKPLIQWTIEAGLRSSAIDRVIVSTDDPRIAEISRLCGADVPFLRPDSLARDSSGSYEVLEHAYKYLHDQGDCYDYLVMLQPTSPLRTSRHIDEAANFLAEKKADGVISVAKITHPIEWCATLSDSMEMKNFVESIDAQLQSQRVENKFCLNGAIYITSIQRMLQEKSHIYGSCMYAYVMNYRDSIDIDNPVDFEIAELLSDLSDNT